VVEDTRCIFKKDQILPSRVVLREIIKGTMVELIDEDGSIITLKRV
jgi:phosphoribosylaminoimidazole-succinocarboxamide synthase